MSGESDHSDVETQNLNSNDEAKITENVTDTKVNFDSILVNEIGAFGRYQVRTLGWAIFPAIIGAFHAEYLFTSARINTRCLIPECEETPSDFAPPWIHNAIPTNGGILDKCHRYGPADVSSKSWNDTCPMTLFNTSTVQECKELVYENKLSVVYDFDLGCDEWRRTIIGTARKVGGFPALPFTGYISDRWGRRTALVINCFNAAWIGLTRYWITSYPGFLLSEILESFFGCGIFSSMYLLVLEFVGPEYRIMAGGSLFCFFAVGNVILGLVAWAIPYWRSLTLALYIPQLFTIGYLWTVSESVRWFMSKGRYAESERQLKKVAKINGKELSNKSLELLRLTVEKEKIRNQELKLQKETEPWLPILVYRHKKILQRCVVVSFWWITVSFTYYGMMVNSVNMVGNEYVNFIAVALAGVPGFLLAIYLPNKLGRKPVLMIGFWICAGAQFAYVFMPKAMYGVSLSIYLLGKCAISVSMSTMYVYTSEVFPTEYRHNLLSYCSMMGRFCAIAAPLTPAFAAAIFPEMPFILFGSFALVSGSLVSLMPETLGTKLPDTMEEAERIGVNNQTKYDIVGDSPCEARP